MYSKGPYSEHAVLPVPPRPKVVSARWINFSTGRYELDATTGGFRRMPPTVQRVVIIASQVLATNGPFNTLQERNRIRTEIRNSLSELTKQPAPIMQKSPISASCRIAAFIPMRTLFPILRQLITAP